MKPLLVVALAGALSATAISQAVADSAMTARKFQTLNTDQRTFYIGGIIHMLMLHTVIVDGGDETRARCINDWFFKGDGPKHIKAAFDRYPDDKPPALVEAMMRLECGKGNDVEQPNLNRRRGD